MSSCSQISFISKSFSIISCISWIFAQLPQIIENYQRKSAKGISPSFLLLWFLGDFLSFSSCLLNNQTLDFQLYLSIFFLCNDITLCFQYYYYNSVYPRRMVEVYSGRESYSDAGITKGVELHTVEGFDIKQHDGMLMQRLNSDDGISSTPSSYSSTDENKNSILKNVAGAVLINASTVNAFSNNVNIATTGHNLGRILAWGCTIVYCSSRCPQLYKNYKRKSVDGISPLLFGSALLGNLTYTLSILTSCSFVLSENRSSFLLEELPYILGSSGTIIFDAAYFYQKHLYKDSGINTSSMTLEPWNDSHTV